MMMTTMMKKRKNTLVGKSKRNSVGVQCTAITLCDAPMQVAIYRLLGFLQLSPLQHCDHPVQFAKYRVEYTVGFSSIE